MNTKTLLEASNGVKPYKPTPPVKQGNDSPKVLKLNSNENLFLSKELLKEVLLEASYETDPRLYPQEEEKRLTERLAELNKVESSEVMITAGGDQLIELLFSLLSSGDKVTAVSPTFSMYPRAAKQRKVELVEAQLTPDFTLDLEKTLKLAEGSELLIVCNPNNPTGNQFKEEDIIRLIEGFDGFVLLDEAYQEYSEYNMANKIEAYPNLIILRTFSKAYGLAGLRLGYCIASGDLVEVLRERYMMPYPVSNLVMNAGIKILDNYQTVMSTVLEAKKERTWLTEELGKLSGVKAFDSEACFVLFKTETPTQTVYDTLLSKGVIISRQNVFNEEYLRVTVAPRFMGERFIEALKEATM